MATGGGIWVAAGEVLWLALQYLPIECFCLIKLALLMQGKRSFKIASIDLCCSIGLLGNCCNRAPWLRDVWSALLHCVSEDDSIGQATA